MSKKTIAKSFSRDLIYSVAGLVLMNVVIQFAAYPYLQSRIGSDAFGIVLSLFSVISIMCGAFATGANYSRMVVSTKQSDVKGDYNIFLVAVCVVSLVVAVFACIAVGWTSPAVIVGYCALTTFTILRYFSDVNFRLALNYRGFFIYYAVISAGYLAGVAILWWGQGTIDLLHYWWISLLLGEVAAVLFVIIKGDIYKSPFFAPSRHFKENITSILALSSAYLLSVVVMNADRLLLLFFVDGTAVTVFYAASLVGKTVALLTGPLNGVVIGYLSKYEGGVTKAFMGKTTGALVVAGALLSLVTVGLSYILVAFLYPSVFEATKPLFIVASVGQAFYFLSETLLVVVLKVASEKYQLYINIIYAVLFFAVALPCVILWQVWGIAVAILVVNILRFALVAAFGFRQADR